MHIALHSDFGAGSADYDDGFGFCDELRTSSASPSSSFSLLLSQKNLIVPTSSDHCAPGCTDTDTGNDFRIRSKEIEEEEVVTGACYPEMCCIQESKQIVKGAMFEQSPTCDTLWEAGKEAGGQHSRSDPYSQQLAPVQNPEQQILALEHKPAVRSMATGRNRCLDQAVVEMDP